MKWLKDLLVMVTAIGILAVAGCGDSDSPTEPSVQLVGTTMWKGEVTEETITDNPFGACSVTDVGLVFYVRIEPVGSKSFNVTITQSATELSGTGNIRGSEYRFSVEGTDMEQGVPINVRMEGTLTLLSETLAGGNLTYEYGQGEGGTTLCKGQEKFLATRLNAPIDLPDGVTMEVVWIKRGTFMMGSPSSEPGRSSNEGPQHEVTISRGFYLGKYEVTQGEWESVMGTTPWAGEWGVRESSENPAVYISWEDVQGFIAKLNAAGEDVYRLPTAAEWEYACRAGENTRWSFGDDESELGEYAWCEDNACDVGECYARAVGTKKPNPWGLYDMHGNVWEWCEDWYEEDYYSSSSRVDPTGPSDGSYRIGRGGSFGFRAQHTRSAFRSYYSPLHRDYDVGFRLLRTR